MAAARLGLSLEPSSEISEGDYEILKAVGKGGSSTVYKGRLLKDSVRERYVAIKSIDVDGLSSDQALSIQGEIDTIKGLSHDHIVSYLGTRTHGNKILIFLEYADRGSLRQFYQRRGPLSEPQVANCARQILQGLVYLHSNGIAHRDIKCANCLLTHGGVIKLADFGASKRCESESVVSGLKGTPHWMAPEVIRGTQMTTGWMKADVWSVGCTLIEMLTGRLPFSNYDHPMTAMYHIANGEAPSAREVPISPDLAALVTACCAADPSARPEAEALFGMPFLVRRGRDPATTSNSHTTPGPHTKGTPEPFMSPENAPPREEEELAPSLLVGALSSEAVQGAQGSIDPPTTPTKPLPIHQVSANECTGGDANNESRIDTSIGYAEADSLEVDDYASDCRLSEGDARVNTGDGDEMDEAERSAESVTANGSNPNPSASAGEASPDVEGDNFPANPLALQHPPPPPKVALEDMPTPTMAHGRRNFFPDSTQSSSTALTSDESSDASTSAGADVAAAEAVAIQAGYAGQRPGHAIQAEARTRPHPTEEPPAVLLTLPHRADRIRSRIRASPNVNSSDAGLLQSVDSRGSITESSVGDVSLDSTARNSNAQSRPGTEEIKITAESHSHSQANSIVQQTRNSHQSQCASRTVGINASGGSGVDQSGRPKAPLTSEKLRRVSGLTAGSVRRAAQEELEASEQETRAPLRIGINSADYSSRPTGPGFPVFRRNARLAKDGLGARSKSANGASIPGDDRRLPPVALLALGRTSVEPSATSTSVNEPLTAPARHIHSAPALSRSLTHSLPPISTTLQMSSTPTFRTAQPNPFGVRP